MNRGTRRAARRWAAMSPAGGRKGGEHGGREMIRACRGAPGAPAGGFGPAVAHHLMQPAVPGTRPHPAGRPRRCRGSCSGRRGHGRKP
jgi:hypothetical protein